VVSTCDVVAATWARDDSDEARFEATPEALSEAPSRLRGDAVALATDAAPCSAAAIVRKLSPFCSCSLIGCWS
jgi:hypothetical protein